MSELSRMTIDLCVTEPTPNQSLKSEETESFYRPDFRFQSTKSIELTQSLSFQIQNSFKNEIFDKPENANFPNSLFEEIKNKPKEILQSEKVSI